MSSLMTRVEIATSLARCGGARVVRSATLIPGFSPPKRPRASAQRALPCRHFQFRERSRFYPIPPVCLLQRQPEAPANEQDGHYQACRQNCRMSRMSGAPTWQRAPQGRGRPRAVGSFRWNRWRSSRRAESGTGIPPLRMLCRHFRQIVSRSRGTFGFNREGETGSSSIACRSVSEAVSPRNGGLPVSIS